MIEKRKHRLLGLLQTLENDIREIIEQDNGIWNAPPTTEEKKEKIPMLVWTNLFESYNDRYRILFDKAIELYKEDETYDLLGERGKVKVASFSALLSLVSKIRSFVDGDIDWSKIELLEKENTEMKLKLKSISKIK